MCSSLTELDCPDPTVSYKGGNENPKIVGRTELVDVGGGVKLIDHECPAGLFPSVPQPNSYQCDKLGSFNIHNYFDNFRLPACGRKFSNYGN